jgi:hypothetical protein
VQTSATPLDDIWATGSGLPVVRATRPFRLGIDTTTVPVPPDGYLSRYFDHDEIDMQLLVPVGQAATAPSPLLGCVQALPGENEPPLPERAMFHQALFGWHPA